MTSCPHGAHSMQTPMMSCYVIPMWCKWNVNTNDIMPMWYASHANPNDVTSGMCVQAHMHDECS